MATIIARRLKDGSRSYRATIRIMRGNTILHRETRSFPSKPVAAQWSRQRESELKRDGVGEKAAASLKAQAEVRVAVLIDRYIEEFWSIKQWAASKSYDLQFLRRIAGHWDASTLTAEPVLDHVRQRRLAGAGPATINAHLKLLRVIFKVARGAWGKPVQLHALEDAIHTARHLQLVAPGKQRERRPSDEELARLRVWLARDGSRRKLPMCDIVDFAIASTRRQSEIFRLRWSDIQRDAMTIVVRDMKSPRGSKGNDVTVKLTREALAIIDRQNRGSDDRIFPFEPLTAREDFARACRRLGIHDLHFHDLRHEAISRLFEAGYQIHEVTQFSGHKDWETLRRYTNLRPANLQLRE